MMWTTVPVSFSSLCSCSDARKPVYMLIHEFNGHRYSKRMELRTVYIYGAPDALARCLMESGAS